MQLYSPMGQQNLCFFLLFFLDDRQLSYKLFLDDAAIEESSLLRLCSTMCSTVNINSIIEHCQWAQHIPTKKGGGLYKFGHYI